jgi:hypothetical protein
MSIMKPDREMASVPRRLLAAGLNTVFFVGALTGALVSRGRAKKRRSKNSRRSDRPGSASVLQLERAHEWFRTRNGRVAFHIGSLLLIGIPSRNLRSPGGWMTGIKTVDARTGGPVKIRSVVIANVAGLATGQVTKRLTRPLVAKADRAEQRRALLTEQVEQLRREYADDPAAQTEAIMSLYKANDVNPLASIAWRIPTLLISPLAALFTPDHQTIVQRVAGVAIVRAPRRRRP